MAQVMCVESIEIILRSDRKPKQKQEILVAAICDGRISDKDFFDFFASASDVDKGSCADVLKHVSERKPHILAPHLDKLIGYVNYNAPRVKWGVPEAIGNLAGIYPEEAARAIPLLLNNAVESKANTTVVRWCAAYALSEIAKSNPSIRSELVPRIKALARSEKNNGVRNLYLKALKAIEK